VTINQNISKKVKNTSSLPLLTVVPLALFYFAITAICFQNDGKVTIVTLRLKMHVKKGMKIPETP
jgi:hypothetical protein